jgi:hypothetical protein
MRIQLPSFSDPLLHRLQVCVITSDTSLVDRLKGISCDWDAQYGDDFWVHVEISLSEADRIHFHVDAVRSFGAGKSAATSTVDEVLERIAIADGVEAKAWVGALYKFAEEQYPKKGIIPAISITTEVAGTTLALTGAEISFQEGPFDELKWSMGSDGKLNVFLDALLPIKFDAELLLRAEKSLRSGLNRFVLSISEEST